jgi:hypothetical protein
LFPAPRPKAGITNKSGIKASNKTKTTAETTAVFDRSEQIPDIEEAATK